MAGNNQEATQRGSALALLPVGVFLVLFLGTGILFHDFYATPAIVGFLIALLVAFVQDRKTSFQEKINIISNGVGEENMITMSLIFLCAGGFSGAVKAAGGVDSTVNLGLSLIPSHFAVAGLFLIGCFISVSMGTSVGTITALAPIAAGISEKTGFSMGICIAAVVCGAMFGDNLSMISDTTIAAVKTQGCEMKDKFKANFLIVLPAAVIAMILFYVATKDVPAAMQTNLSYDVWKVVPYLLVLIGALIGINVFLVLLVGIISSLLVGCLTGSIALTAIFQVVGEGVTSMYDITVISMIVACIVSLVRARGGITFLLQLIKRRLRGHRGAQFGIALLSLFVDMCTANNTVAIVMAGPIVKDISDEYHIDPKRSASLIDIFTSVGQGMIPYGAQLLTAASLTGLTPFGIIPHLYYPVLMGVSAIIFIIFDRRPREAVKGNAV